MRTLTGICFYLATYWYFCCCNFLGMKYQVCYDRFVHNNLFLFTPSEFSYVSDGVLMLNALHWLWLCGSGQLAHIHYLWSPPGSLGFIPEPQKEPLFRRPSVKNSLQSHISMYNLCTSWRMCLLLVNREHETIWAVCFQHIGHMFPEHQLHLSVMLAMWVWTTTPSDHYTANSLFSSHGMLLNNCENTPNCHCALLLSATNTGGQRNVSF